MTPMLISIIGSVLSGITLAGLTALFRILHAFRTEQREANRRNTESIRSMQRAELLRMFQRVVEDGHPVTVEELEHLEACYKAYHANGGNGTGTLMYERIREYAVIKTKGGEQ